MKFQGTKGHWYLSEGWVDGHISLSSDDHGAFAQVLIEMEDTTSDSKRKELESNAKVMVIAAEMYDLVASLQSDEKVHEMLKVLNPSLAEKVNELLLYVEKDITIK